MPESEAKLFIEQDGETKVYTPTDMLPDEVEPDEYQFYIYCPYCDTEYSSTHDSLPDSLSHVCDGCGYTINIYDELDDDNKIRMLLDRMGEIERERYIRHSGQKSQIDNDKRQRMKLYHISNMFAYFLFIFSPITVGIVLIYVSVNFSRILGVISGLLTFFIFGAILIFSERKTMDVFEEYVLSVPNYDNRDLVRSRRNRRLFLQTSTQIEDDPEKVTSRYKFLE